MDSRLFDNLQNRGLTRGSVVQSRAGHDQLRIFLVLRTAGGFAWLADGRSRCHERPKKKRVSHVRPLGRLADSGILDQIEALGDPGRQNAALRRLLDDFLAAIPKKEGQ